ncbi:MAG: tetratricopeptide repeat protein [Planctomycetota bacterium]|nr:tetratricopeptide repeat protein [Planctomycetota bacterium]
MKSLKHTAAFGFVLLTLGMVGCSSHSSMPPSVAEAQKLQEAGQLPPAPPLTADTRFAAGQLAESQGHNEIAIKQYLAAIKIDSKHQPSLYRLGCLYAELKQYDNAIATWQDYVKATDETAAAYSNLGYCFELAGRNNEAEAAYHKGIAKDQSNLSCRTNYGLMLARHNRIPEAVRTWSPVLTEAEIHYNLASVYELDGRKFEARTEYEKALELDPKLGDAKNRLSSLQ